MGNTFDSRPGSYSDQTTYGKEAHTYGGDWEAAYRQSSSTADSMAYGNTRLQFGVKMLEDVDPGPNQGQMYVNTVAGKRVYFTYKGQLYPDARQRIAQGANFGNGPAVSITGSPVDPQYHMYYAQGGDEHKGDDWTPIQIKSKNDVMEAMRSGNQGRDINTGKYSNMYGQASINPFGSKEGGDVWTGAVAFDNTITGVLSQLAVPVIEMGLDEVVPFASQILAVTGANTAIQGGIDSLMAATQGKTYQGTKNFDPEMSNMIKDPRLPGYLQQIKDQSHAFIAKYGDSSYSASQKLAQDTPSQQITKAKQLAQENQDLYVQSQVQMMSSTAEKLQQMLPNADPTVFNQIKTGLSMATNNQQKMNVIAHFSKQLKTDVIPLLTQAPVAAPSEAPSSPAAAEKSQTLTASAQVGHPDLSINGDDTRHPAKPIHSWAPIPVVPF